ncbi:MAG: M20/M25/M40 family metallo-hydrolase [Streptosporangiales bacterium]|nr:M20/M25/M40 family metallo-hydrolase [Streptosporangiales bacterium]
MGRVSAELLPFGRERLRTYALVESPSGNVAALGTLGEEIADGHEAAGGRPARVPGPTGDHLVTAWEGAAGSAGHVLLLGHSDTVWPVGQLSAMPYTDDGKLIAGPGVYDMKGGLVVLEMAMRILAALGLRAARPVRAVVVADEEVGSPHGGEVVERNLDGASAVLGLEGPHRDGGLKTARRGSTRLRLTVEGREAHAAVDPGRGISAIDELLDQLVDARQVIPDDGSTLFNVGRIGGGTRSNVVAGEAWAEIGLRFTTADAERTVLSALTGARPRRTGARLAAEVLSRRPTWTPREDNPLLDTVVRVSEALGQRLTGRPAPGAGDTNLPGSRGLPTLDGFGPQGRGAHAADEAIVVRSLAERAALLAGVLATGPPVP